MARVGAELLNPVTRERFVWRATAASTDGAYCEADLYLAPGATLAAAHTHPQQREDFRVESGVIVLEAGGERRELRAGDSHSIPPDTAHAWGQSGPDETHVVVRLTPALRTEDFFETFCGLARDGKTTKKGLPRSPLQLAVLAHAFRAELAPPPGIQRLLGAVLVPPLAALGRARGYRTRYPEYSSD